MKFATKLSLGCITLLSCALCAAGLILTGKSFSGSLETTRAAMQAQQAKEKYTLERCIFTVAAKYSNPTVCKTFAKYFAYFFKASCSCFQHKLSFG